MIKKTLYFGNPARLNVQNRQLRIVLSSSDENSEERVVSRPLEDIGMVIVDSPQIVITSSVMSGLMECGAALVICDNKHLPSGLMVNLDGHTLQSERFRIQMAASLPLKKQLWSQTVSAKVYNQAVALEKCEIEGGLYLRRLLDKIKSGDSGNVEGQAAAHYWKCMLESLPAETRRRDGESPNDLLNYGYSIVRAIAARALVSSGMHPSIGIFHKNKYNAYCLADDLMEPYRPYVDLVAIQLCREYENPVLEDKEIKRRLLEICNVDVHIGGKRRPLTTAVSESAASLFKCFAGEIKKISYPQMI